MALIRKHFDSLTEFCTAPFVHQANKTRCHNTLQSSSGVWNTRGDDPESWLGARTAQIAADRVTQGWPEGADEVLKALADIGDVPAPMDVRRKMTRADQGDELDIHAVYRGALETAWTSKRRRTSRGKRTVRIVAQTNLLSETTFEQMFWRGASVVKLADVLSAAGYSVEIIAAMSTVEGDGGGNYEYLVTFPLKNAQDPLDLEGVAGVLCNAGFHRLFGFRAYLALADWTRRYNAGTDTSDRRNVLINQEDFGKDGVKTFVTNYDTNSATAAAAWIKDCLTQLDAETA